MSASLGARLRREGDDLLLVSWGPTVHTCLLAADELEERHGLRSAVLGGDGDELAARHAHACADRIACVVILVQ